MAITGVTLIALEWGLFVPLAVVFILTRFIIQRLYPSNSTWPSSWAIAVSFGLFLVTSSLNTVAWHGGFFNSQASLSAPVSHDTTVYGLKVRGFC